MLSRASDECFAQEGNLNLPLDARNGFSARRRQLSNIVDQLMEKDFHKLTPNFKNLQQLQTTNTTLSVKIAELDGIAKTVESAGKVLNIVDQIIQIGTTLVTLV